MNTYNSRDFFAKRRDGRPEAMRALLLGRDLYIVHKQNLQLLIFVSRCLFFFFALYIEQRRGKVLKPVNNIRDFFKYRSEKPVKNRGKNKDCTEN